MRFLQHLPLKYKFWAVNGVAFAATLALVLVALGVEQRTIEHSRQKLAQAIAASPATQAQADGVQWINAPAGQSGSNRWVDATALGNQQAQRFTGAWLAGDGKGARAVWRRRAAPADWQLPAAAPRG